MDLYVIVNDKGNVLGDKAFVSSDVAEQARNDMECYSPFRNEGYHLGIVNINDDSFPIGRHIYFATIYRGFDYGWDSMYDVTSQDAQFYTCKSDLKSGEFWSKWLKETHGKECDFNFYEDRICSKDVFEDDWRYGDVMEDKFSLEIRKLRVDKSQ